jgi:hypothetical protein
MSFRGVTLGRRAAISLAGTAALLLVWAGGATWYVATRDDLAQRVFVRETELQYRYEDRIVALQTELERAVTQNLVERNGVTARLDGVARRQADIENRQAWLGRLAERLPADTRAGSSGSTGERLPPPERSSGCRSQPRSPSLSRFDFTMPRRRSRPRRSPRVTGFP